MNDLLVWIIDEEWSDYEVEKELIKKRFRMQKSVIPGMTIKKILKSLDIRQT